MAINSGPYGMLELNEGFWILEYDQKYGTPQTPCGPDLPGAWVDGVFKIEPGTDVREVTYRPDCHHFHCVSCGKGTDPGPLDGIELREVFEPSEQADRAWYQPGDNRELDDNGPMGDGYELCAQCFEVLQWLL